LLETTLYGVESIWGFIFINFQHWHQKLH